MASRGAARAVLLAATLALTAGAAPAQTELPPALAGLVGEWRGTGQLMGREAAFEMSWSPVHGGRFLRLEFSNAFVDPDSGATQTVLTATALYRPGEDGATATGQWFDSRGLILPLAAELQGDTVVTRWGDDGTREQGRTTYRVLGPDAIEVSDEVLRDGEYAPFGSARYQRVEG